MNQLPGPLRFIVIFLGLLLLPSQLFGYGGPPAPAGGDAFPYRTTRTDNRILVMPVQFSGSAANPLSQAAAQTAINEMDTWIRGASFGTFGFSVRTATTVLTLSNTKAYYTAAGLDTLLTDARAAAVAANSAWAAANFEFDVVISESGTLPNAGIAKRGFKGMWIPNSASEPFAKSSFIHELGHNLGLNHAGGWLRPSGSTNPLDPAGIFEAYGSLYDPLAYAGYPCHYSAHYKNLIGWLPAANVAVIDSTTVTNVRLYAHDGGSMNPSRKYAIRIPASVADAVSPGNRDIWLETRTIFNAGVPANKRDGLFVKWGDQRGSTQGSCDLDLTPNSLAPNNTIDDFADAILTVGTLFADPWNAAPGTNRITVTPVASGGTGADKYVDVAITTPNADLSALSFSTGALSPAFASGSASYDVTAIGATSTTVTATAAAGATIQVRANGGAYTNLTSGTASGALALLGGSNVIDVKVTNGGWTRTYTANIATLQAFPAVAGSLGAIPDDSATFGVEGSQRNVQFAVSGLSGSLTSVAVNFTLNPAHVYGSDVVVKLIAPNGTTSHTVMAVNPLDDDTNLEGPYTFADDAAGPISAALGAVTGGTAAAGRYRTQSNQSTTTTLLTTFSALSGAALNGTWTLRFTDRFNGDGGGVGAANLFLATAGGVSSPTVTTATQNSVTATTATLGGNVTADGGASITDRGIVWATTATPTIANNKVANGTGTGIFSGTVTGLPAGTLIYVRAYATNTAGTGYGSQISFTTLSSNADLSALATTAGTLPFAAATTSYTASVPNATTSVTVTPTVADANATVTVSGTSVVSGNASGNISLTVGANAIPVVVTAQSGATKTYTLNVTRAAPALTGVAITPTSVITTSQWINPDAGVRGKMIDGSGLSGGGSVLDQTHDQLVTAETMWHAGPDGGGLSGGTTGNPPTVASQAVEFDLGANYNLTGAHIWNMNQQNVIGRGVKDVQILVSSATTGAFTPLITTIFTQGTGNAGLAAQVVPLTGANNVRRVRFAIQTAWSGEANEYVGLSEVRFQGTAAVGNLPPTITAIPNLTMLEDGWDTSTTFTVADPNPGSTLTVTQASDNTALIRFDDTDYYTIVRDGDSYNFGIAPVANMTGTANVTITVSDGTLTATRVFVVTVTGVNDQPAFTYNDPATISVAAGSGLQTRPGIATGISPGPANESSQTVAFVVTNDNNPLFSIQPAINAAGNLSFTPGNSAGTATVSFQARDSGGTANGGVNASSPVRTFTIELTASTNQVTVDGSNLGEIPRGNPGGRDVLLDVTGKTGVVTGVTVQFTLSPKHTYAVDLSVALIAPDNTTAQIFRMVPLASADLGGPYTFQDSATGYLSVAAPALPGDVQVPSGSYRAENNGTQILLNTVFAGKAPNGTWKLRFIDDNTFDTGTISQASLTLTLTPTTASPGKIAIQPDPNGHMTPNLTAAAPNANYDLMRSTDLQNWTLLQSKTTNASGTTTHTDPAPPAPRGFYRYIPRP